MDTEKIVTQVRDDFFKFIPLIPIWLTILGAAKLYLYYKPFRINIFTYLDLQEVLLLFISDFYGLIFSFTSLFIILFVSEQTEPINYSKYFAPPQWWHNMSNLKRMILTIIYGVLTNPIIIFIIILRLIDTYSVTEYPSVSTFAIIAIAFMFRNRLYAFLIKHVDRSLARVYIAYLSFLMALSVWTFISITKKNLEYSFSKGGYLKIENQLINFDNNQYLIGRTKNYSFIFTPADSCTRVVNNSEIKELFVKAQ